MMKRICLAFALFVLGTSPLLAQSSVLPYFYTTGNTKVAVGNSNPLPVTISGGGGGGLSVQDQASWTQGSSNMTPVGCAYNDTATLTSGQQGTVRCNTKRAAIVDVDTTGNNLYSALTSSIPAGTNLIGDVNLRQGGTALSTTNGAYFNQLQGNAVLSATNGAYYNQLQGNAVLSLTNPAFFRPTDGTNGQVFGPCQTVAATYTPINISTATTTRIVTETAAKKTYICSIHVVTNAANNVAMIEGTGASCSGGTPAGMAGGTTASSGWNFSANGGIALGNGQRAIAATANQAYSVCLVTSAATQLSGTVAWVQQ